jgi:hypothetical protein
MTFGYSLPSLSWLRLAGVDTDGVGARQLVEFIKRIGDGAAISEQHPQFLILKGERGHRSDRPVQDFLIWGQYQRLLPWGASTARSPYQPQRPPTSASRPVAVKTRLMALNE